MSTHNLSIGRRLLAASVLAVGFGTLWAILAAWIGVSVLNSWRGESHLRQEALMVAADGTPLIRSVPLDNLSMLTYRDLDGRDHSDVDSDKDLVNAAYLYGEHERVDAFFLQPAWQSRIKVFNDEREPAAVWYFVHYDRAGGTGGFVGYERVSNRLIGYIGLSGFSARPLPPAERIPVRSELYNDYGSWSSWPLSINAGALRMPRVDPWDVPPRLVHVPSGNLLRVVDLSARTTTTVFEAPTSISSVGVPSISPWGWDSKQEQPILVRAGDKVYKLDHEYHVVGVVTLPAEIGSRVAMSWYEVDDGRAVVVCPLPTSSEEGVRDYVSKSMVYRFAADGTVESSLELTLQTGSAQMSEQAAFSLTAFSLPAPVPLLGFDSFLTVVGYGSSDYPRRLRIMLMRAWPSLAATLALAVVLAVVAWRRGAGFGLSGREQNAWAAFVLLLGVPGFIGFLLHRRWPPREPCPHCHASVPRDRESCVACGTPFPAPAPKGTEIFT